MPTKKTARKTAPKTRLERAEAARKRLVNRVRREAKAFSKDRRAALVDALDRALDRVGLVRKSALGAVASAAE
jgi:hypothetical protein